MRPFCKEIEKDRIMMNIASSLKNAWRKIINTSIEIQELPYLNS